MKNILSLLLLCFITLTSQGQDPGQMIGPDLPAHLKDFCSCVTRNPHCMSACEKLIAEIALHKFLILKNQERLEDIEERLDAADIILDCVQCESFRIVPYNISNFTANNGATWNVNPNFQTVQYWMANDSVMFISIKIFNTSVTGISDPTILSIKIPNGRTALNAGFVSVGHYEDQIPLTSFSNGLISLNTQVIGGKINITKEDQTGNVPFQGSSIDIEFQMMIGLQ